MLGSPHLEPVAKLIELAGGRPKVVIAFSGGLDSTVLTHALLEQRTRLGSLRLVHVDHGLQAASAEWSRHCERQARRWRVPIQVLRVNASPRSGESPEAAARRARYAALRDSLRAGEILITAQHSDDQAETLLLQLLRGAGVPGLAAMPAFMTFEPGHLARPLLDVTRTDLEKIGRQAKLDWIEDPSNADTRFSRNFVRHRVMPTLREHWPGAVRALVRVASNMAEAAQLLQERGDADLAALADGSGLSVPGLRALSPVRRRNALRAFIARAGLTMPDSAQLREMSGPLLAARPDAQPEVRWANASLVRRSGRIELGCVPAATPFHPAIWRWKRQRRFSLPQGSLELVEDESGPIDLDRLPAILRLRGRDGGEKLRPSVDARTRSLKKLLQDARLTPEERARLPLLFSGRGAREKLVLVADRWVDASIAPRARSSRRARLEWVPARRR